MDLLRENSLFKRGLRLLAGAIYTDIQEQKNYISTRSDFNDPWHDLLIPTSRDADTALKPLMDELRRRNKGSVSSSIYLPDGLSRYYFKRLVGEGLIELDEELWMLRELKGRRFTTKSTTIVPVERKHRTLYLRMAETCFPDWRVVRQYSESFLQLSWDQPELYSTYLLHDGSEFVGFGSSITSKRENLIYLHNTGTAPNFRRKGYYTELLKHRLNSALELGITEALAIVNPGSGSYHGIKNLGFDQFYKFHLYSNGE